MTAQKTGASSQRRVLHHGQPSTRARFVQPVVLKQASLFLLCTDVGDMQPESDQGLYFHDMRDLSRQDLRVNGSSLVSLLADAGDGHRAVFELTNHDLDDEHGQLSIGKESLGVRREKLLGDD